MISSLHAICVLVLSGTLLASGVLKLRDRAGALAGIRGFSVIPSALAPLIATALPVAELILGASLVVLPGAAFTLTAALAASLMFAFTALVALTLGRGEAPSCHCFGELSAEPISVRTLIRNVALTAVAVLVLGLVRPFDGLLPSLLAHDAVWGAFVVVTASGLGVIAWLWSARAASLTRIAELTATIADLEARPLANVPVEIPDVRVTGSDGVQVALTDIVERAGKAQLILGVSPTCGACKDLLAGVPGWRQELEHQIGVTLLSWGTWDDSVAAYGDQAEHLYASPDGSAFQALKIGGTPSAVVLGLNGVVAAGPAHGLEQIVELLSAIVAAIGVNAMTGRLHGVQESRPLGGGDSGADHLPPPGTLLETVMVRDASGVVSTLTAALDKISPDAVPVVAWRDSCPYCGEIVDELRQFSDRGEVVLLVNEPIAGVRAQGLTGPVLQTIEADASRAIMVPGTPGGMPIEQGATLAGGGVGGGSVLRMLKERAQGLGTYVPTPALEQLLGTPVHQH